MRSCWQYPSGISFTLTWFTWKEEAEDGSSSGNTKAAAKEKAEPAETEGPKGAEGAGKAVLVPLKGTVIAREEIPDPTFASGILGDGAGIIPEVGEVVAPFDGEIASVTDTRHAIGLTGPEGMEVLIHVGIDTVKMNGDGFQLLVSQGEKVKAGQRLLTFDISKIEKAGYSTDNGGAYGKQRLLSGL